VVAGSTPEAESGGGYAWYVVIVLMLAYTLSFVDRQILSLLVKPIKAELQISDTQIGLLQGFAFALFYTVLGLPMGRIVDRYNRRNLIAGGVFLWSLMTTVAGGARSFGALFAARMGVGLGEATLSPAALSLITDYFRRSGLGTALSIYSLGIFIGAGTAFMVGGTLAGALAGRPDVSLPLLGNMSAWRLVFFIVGAPGLLLALVVSRLREPARTGALLARDGLAERLPVSAVVLQIRARWRPVAAVTVGMACHAICMYSVFAWMPTYFMRAFDWPPARAGMAVGAIVLVFGCAGMASGGRLCDRWHAAGVAHAALRIGTLGATLAGLGVVAVTHLGVPLLAVALLAPTIFGLALPIGSMFAALQLLFPNQVRGQICAAFLFVISLVGISLGPLLPGLLNDRLFGGGAGIGPALAVTVSLSALTMALVCRAGYASFASAPAAN
jgi:MFS family permease